MKQQRYKLILDPELELFRVARTQRLLYSCNDAKLTTWLIIKGLLSKEKVNHKTFLTEYGTMLESYETPEIYDLWAAMATLSSVLSRKIWFDLGNIRIFPNLYVVLVGPPGARKNTAMACCKELLEAIGDIPMVAGAITREKLVEHMMNECSRTFLDPEKGLESEYTPITVFANELTHFLGTNPTAAIHMVDFLVDIFDRVGDYDAKTITRGDNKVVLPCLNLFAATTPSNITRYLKEEALSGGMARRTIFVNAQRVKHPIAIPEVSTETIAAKAWCLEWLARVHTTIRGPLTFSPEGRAWYIPWYKQMFEQSQKETSDLIGGYLSSKHIQMFKVAMLVSINRGTDMLLTPEDMETADALLCKVEAELPEVYEGLGPNELAAIARQIVEAVHGTGGKMQDKEIRRVFFSATKELPAVLQHLYETEKLFKLVEKNADGTIRRAYWVTPDHPDLLRAKGAVAPEIAPKPLPPT